MLNEAIAATLAEAYVPWWCSERRQGSLSQADLGHGPTACFMGDYLAPSQHKLRNALSHRGILGNANWECHREPPTPMHANTRTRRATMDRAANKRIQFFLEFAGPPDLRISWQACTTCCLPPLCPPTSSWWLQCAASMKGRHAMRGRESTGSERDVR